MIDIAEIKRANDQSRSRLAEVVRRLSESQLKLTVNYGWSVAMALAHLAFWDYYGVARLDDWERNGIPEHHPGTETINDAMRPMLEAIPAQNAVRMVLEAAEAIDRKVANVRAELADAIIAAGRERVLNRAPHRTLHLDDIESSIRAK